MGSVKVPPIEMVMLPMLKVDGQNPNRMTERQRKQLRDSIERWGFIVPIITNKDLLIADGEQRYEVARDLCMPEVPVIRLPVEDVGRRLIRQVLNKVRGEHEFLLDAEEFDRIIDAGERENLKELLALNEGSLERYLREIHPAKDEDYEIPEIEKIQTDIERGDIILLGKHRLMCGNATQIEDIRRLLGETKINMVFTDPPYNVDYASKNAFLNLADKGNRIQTPITNDKTDIEPLLNSVWANIQPYLAEYNALYCCGVGSSLHNLFNTLEDNGYFISQVLVWVKNNIVLGRQDYQNQHEFLVYGWYGKHKFYGKNQRSVWEIDKPNKSELHPTMKPFPLMLKAMLNSSEPNANILDVFGGSGSTLIVAEDLGRSCFTMEIEPHYCQIIVDRWEKYTGQKAVKLNGRPETVEASSANH